MNQVDDILKNLLINKKIMKNKKKFFSQEDLRNLRFKISMDTYLKVSFFSFSGVNLYIKQELRLLLMIH